jgi:hypothetical protein
MSSNFAKSAYGEHEILEAVSGKLLCDGTRPNSQVTEAAVVGIGIGIGIITVSIIVRTKDVPSVP